MEVLSRLPGRIRFKNLKVYRNIDLARCIKIYLEGIHGVIYSNINAATGSILVVFEEKKISEKQLYYNIESAARAAITSKGSSLGRHGDYLRIVEDRDRAKKKVVTYGLLYLLFKAKYFTFGKFSISRSVRILRLAAVISIIGGYPLFKKLVKNMTKGFVSDYDFLLNLTAISLTLFRESDKGVLLLVLKHLNDYIRLASEAECRRILNQNLGNFAGLARIYNACGQEALIPVEQLCEGDIIHVVSGELVPVEGIILEGQGSVNTIYHNGQYSMSQVEKGALLPEGSVLIYGTLKIKVNKIPDSLIKEDLNFDDLQIHNKVDSLQDFLTPLSIGAAALNYVFTGSLERSLSTLLVMCPTASSIALTAGMRNYTALLSKKHIYLRNPNTLENIINTNHIVFDKTGTLTYSKIDDFSKELTKEYYFKGERLRKGTLTLMNSLRKRGYKSISIVTGDSEEKAQALGKHLSISSIYSHCSNLDKVKIIESKKKNGRTMMVGDGINDILAMKSANVSVSFITSACASTKLHSDCIIFDDDLIKLNELFVLSAKAYRKIERDITISKVYNLTFGAVTLVFNIGIFTAESINTVHSLIMLLLSERIRWTLPSESKYIEKKSRTG
jgi:manganese/zinc-transporting P-type ATPase C